MILLALAISVNSLSMESLWKNGKCNSPPDLVTLFEPSIFNDTSTLSSHQSVSPLYSNAIERFLNYQIDYSPNICGLVPYIVKRGCCLAHLHGEINWEAKSVQYINNYQGEVDLLDKANDAWYCVIEPTMNHGDRLVKRYVRQNSGVCLERVMCQNNHLLLYRDANCTVLDSSFVTTETPTTINIGNTTSVIYRYQMKGAGTPRKWVSYIPVAEIVPELDQPWDFLGITTIIVALVISCLVSIYFAGLVWIKEPGSHKLLSVQIGWFTWVLLQLAIWVLPFPDNTSWRILNQCQGVVYNIVSVIGTLESTTTLLNYFEAPTSVRKFSFSFLILVHIVLSGGNYFLFLAYIESVTIFALYWCFGHPFWNLFQVSLNAFPPVYMCYCLAVYDMEESNLPSIHHSFRKLFRLSPLFFYLLGFQFLNTILYGFLYVVVCLTPLPGDDMIWSALIGPICFTNVIHEVINCAITIELRKLILKTKRPDLSYSEFNVIKRMKSKWRGEEIKAYDGPVKETAALDEANQVVQEEVVQEIPGVIIEEAEEEDCPPENKDIVEAGSEPSAEASGSVEMEVQSPTTSNSSSSNPQMFSENSEKRQRRGSLLWVYTNSAKLLPAVDDCDDIALKLQSPIVEVTTNETSEIHKSSISVKKEASVSSVHSGSSIPLSQTNIRSREGSRVNGDNLQTSRRKSSAIYSKTSKQNSESELVVDDQAGVVKVDSGKRNSTSSNSLGNNGASKPVATPANDTDAGNLFTIPRRRNSSMSSNSSARPQLRVSTSFGPTTAPIKSATEPKRENSFTKENSGLFTIPRPRALSKSQNQPQSSVPSTPAQREVSRADSLQVPSVLIISGSQNDLPAVRNEPSINIIGVSGSGILTSSINIGLDSSNIQISDTANTTTNRLTTQSTMIKNNSNIGLSVPTTPMGSNLSVSKKNTDEAKSGSDLFTIPKRRNTLQVGNQILGFNAEKSVGSTSGRRRANTTSTRPTINGTTVQTENSKGEVTDGQKIFTIPRRRTTSFSSKATDRPQIDESK